jgi:hypothetical protein
MDKTELQKLRNRLPHRYTRELSKRTGVNRELVTMIMTGQKRDYHGVIKAAAKWAKEIEEEENEIRNIINDSDS